MLLNCLTANDMIKRPPLATWQDEYTKICVCDRCKVRIDGHGLGDIFVGSRPLDRINPNRRKADGAYGSILAKEQSPGHWECPLQNTKYCPADVCDGGVRCPLKNPPAVEEDRH